VVHQRRPGLWVVWWGDRQVGTYRTLAGALRKFEALKRGKRARRRGRKVA